MKFKILLILAVAAFVALPAEAAVQNVKIGGDLTLLGLARHNFDLRDGQTVQTGNVNDERDYLASIIRIRLDADLTENVAATLRLINQRDWDGESAASTDIDLDLAYLVLKDFMQYPVTLMVGRQELWYGNALIVGGIGSPTPTADSFEAADLSVKHSRDAIRAIIDLSEYAPVTVDAFYAKIDETGTVSNAGTSLNDDVNLYGVTVQYDFDDDYDSAVETYWIMKQSGSNVGTTSNPAQVVERKGEYIHNIGARGSMSPIEDLTLQLEGAYQFGNYVGAAFGDVFHFPGDRSAFAIQAIADFKVPMLTEYSPTLSASYTYLSGEDETSTNDGEYNAWDPMYEGQNPGNIMNALFYFTGIQAVTLTGSIEPIEDLTVTLNNVNAWITSDYTFNSPLIASPTYSDGFAVSTDRHLGMETDLIFAYDYTEDVQLGLTTGIFLPGDAFREVARVDEANNYNTATEDAAWEAIASMKVTF